MFDNSIELRPAFTWDCPECGREHFVRVRIPEFSDAELSELRDEHGVNHWESGNFIAVPKAVNCKFCDRDFAAINIHSEL